MMLLLALLFSLPLRFFDVSPQKLTASEGESERQAITFASINAIQKLRPSDRLTFPTANGDRSYRITRIDEYMPGTLSITAEDPQYPTDFFVMSFQGDQVSGYAMSMRDGSMELFGNDRISGTAYRAKMIPEMLDYIACGTDHSGFTTMEQQLKSQMLGEDIPSENRTHPVSVPMVSDVARKMGVTASQDSVTIDLLMVYTEKAQQWANANENPGSIERAISQAMGLSQRALDASRLAIKLRLVHAHRTDYIEQGGEESNKILQRLTASPTNTPSGWTDVAGYMDEVHQLRDQYGADLVALLTDVSDTGGLAWRLSSHGGSPQYGFSLNRIRQTHYTYTLIHEIGHNMGNDHGRTQARSASDIFGGLNVYSTGYRWKDSQGKGYVDVMHYSSDEYPNLTPYFSSPDVQIDGVTIGKAGYDSTAADNQRSMREIRRTIASYRPTRVGNPVLNTADIAVTVAKGESATFSLDLSNAGNEDVMWNLRQITTVSPSPILRSQGHPVTVFKTGFEPSEGYTSGMHAMVGGWRTFNEDVKIQISSSNPKSGSQHARWVKNTAIDNEAYTFIRSQKFGSATLGHYKASFDFMIHSADARFYVYFQDAVTGQMAGGMLVSNAMVYTYRRGNNGNLSFFSTSEWTVAPGRYHRFEFDLDPYNNRIRYNLNDNVSVDAGLTGGYRINYMEWLPQNPVNSTQIDIDNVLVEQGYQHFPGMKWIKQEGTIRPGVSESIPIEFSTQNLSPGVYKGQFVIDTNAGIKNIPFTVTVTGDDDFILPDQVELAQNYPNPFNPVTTIRYSIGFSAEVTIQVFDVLGRMVNEVVRRHHDPGYYEIPFDAAKLASGPYFYRLTADGKSVTRKMMLIK